MKRAKMDRYIETLKEKVEERLGKQPRVHAASVDKYKKAHHWKEMNIIGDL